MAEVKEETISGTVVRLFFSSPTFVAGKLRLENKWEEVPFAGKVYVREGELITLTGSWGEHPKYGRQFQATGAEGKQDVSAAGVAAWLEANVSGVGKMRAKRIADALGDDFAEVLKNDLPRFSNMTGFGEELCTVIQSKWLENEAVNTTQTKLAAWGLTRHQILELTRSFGAQAAKVIEDDPYELMWILDGFGWKRTDEIAVKSGIPRNHPRRRRAAVIAALRQRREADGWTCNTTTGMLDDAFELLGDDVSAGPEAILDVVADIVAEPKPKALYFPGATTGNIPCIALSGPYHRETTVARFLATSRSENPIIPAADADKTADCYSTITLDGKQVELDESQREAVRLIARNRVVVISGGAGSGKTTLIRAAYEMFGTGCCVGVALCAPTGKAARRMSEVTGGNAMTIHRMLGYNPALQGFDYNEDNRLPYRVVILDEVSMCDIDLAWYLFSAIDDDACLVMIGDHNQLPPVGPGALLRDCLTRELVPSLVLSKCHRQAGALKENCTAILKGIMSPTVRPEPGKIISPWYVYDSLDTTDQVLKAVEKLYTQHIPRWSFDPVWHVQFMTPVHKGPIGTRAINVLLQRLHQEAANGFTPPAVGEDQRPKLYEGDKVIQTKNNYQIGIMNGTIGVVVSTDPLVVDFAGDMATYDNETKGQVELAYCLTPHKMQGSEIPLAITVVHSAHKFMLHRNWLYTAATRAKHTAGFLGDAAGIRAATTRIVSDARRTILGSMVIDKKGGDDEK